MACKLRIKERKRGKRTGNKIHCPSACFSSEPFFPFFCFFSFPLFLACTRIFLHTFAMCPTFYRRGTEKAMKEKDFGGSGKEKRMGVGNDCLCDVPYVVTLPSGIRRQIS